MSVTGARGARSLPAFTPTALSGAELDARTVGRDALIERILGFLRTAATSRNRPHALVVGPRGSGKTHLLAVVLHRLAQDQAVAERLAITWVPEDAIGISSYADLLVATTEHLLDSAAGDRAAKQGALDEARLCRAAHDELGLEKLVRGLLAGRVLVLVLENLDRIFEELGEHGQARLRGFMETTGDLLLLASTPLLFDDVSERERPFFGSFTVQHLEELSVEDGSRLLERIAVEADDDALARFLTTDEAQARVRAVAHLAGGSPRMWIVLAGCMTIELLEELVPLVESMLDQLAPYYKARLDELPATHRKLVAELCRTATLSRDGRIVHEQRGMRTVSDLTVACGIDQRVAATALGRLQEAGWVRGAKRVGTDRRTTWYEVREPLLRHYLQYRETHGEPMRVIVGFLRAWYAPHERGRWLATADPGSLAERYLRRAVSGELRATHSAYIAATPEDLVTGARCLLDDEAQDPRFGVRNVSAGIVAETAALDALRGRSEALRVARSRLAALEPAVGETLAEVIAQALSTTGDRVSATDVLSAAGFAPPVLTRHAPGGSLAEMQARIAQALKAAVPATDARMPARDRVTMRLLAAGWIGSSGDPAQASELLEQTTPLARELTTDDDELRLAVDGERAYFLFESGRRAEGTRLCERVLAERSRLLGPHHPDTIASRSNVAYFIGESGDRVGARDLYATVVADRQRVLGAEHPGTLGSRHRYARYVAEVGDRVGARDLHAAVMADRRRILGVEHPRTLTSRHEHARLVGETGEPGPACELMANIVDDRTRVLGADHPDTLESRHAHAYYLGATGEAEHARDLFAGLVADRERVLGAGHPDTLASRLQHARLVSVTRGPEAAGVILSVAFEHAFRALGLHEPTAWRSDALLASGADPEEPERSVVVGGGRRLSVIAEGLLRLDPALATQLLVAWCQATGGVAEPLLDGAIDRLVAIAVASGRATELAAAVMRSFPHVDASRRARWLAAWLDVSRERDDLVVAHRLLRALSLAREGDATALLALPAEEQRVVEEIMAADDGAQVDARPR